MKLCRKTVNLDKCSRCEYKEFTQMIHVHHIDENRDNTEDSNKIVLCDNCHTSLYFGLWQLKDIGVKKAPTYTMNDGIAAKKTKVAAGLDT